MLGYTNASSGVAYGEYEDQINLMTNTDIVTFEGGPSKWTCQDESTHVSHNIAAGEGTVTVNWTTFINKINHFAGQYNFVYSGSQWTLYGNVITLLDYGITITSGTPIQNDYINVTYSRKAPFSQEVMLERIQNNNTPVVSAYIPEIIPGYTTNTINNGVVTINWATFSTAINNISSIYTFTYTASNTWTLGTTTISTAQLQSTYGISFTGTPAINNNIVVHYSVKEYLDGYGYITKIETNHTPTTHKHSISCANNTLGLSFVATVFNSISTPFTASTFADWLTNNRFLEQYERYFSIEGTVSTNKVNLINRAGNGTGTNGEIKVYFVDNVSAPINCNLINASTTFTDTVTTEAGFVGSLTAVCYVDEPLMDIRVGVKGV